MVGESIQNVFLIQIDASIFGEFEISEFEISRVDCSCTYCTKFLLIPLCPRPRGPSPAEDQARTGRAQGQLSSATTGPGTERDLISSSKASAVTSGLEKR